MWILQWLPNWIFYAILLIGLLAFAATYLLKIIPIPALFVYRTPIQIASLMMIVFGVYMAGSIANNESWLAKVNEVKAKLAEAEAKGAQETVKVVEKVVYREKVVRQKGQDVIKYVDREVVKYDNKCEIPPPFIESHNKATEYEK
jgi:membrane protein implicated in regulation of membrane protease activity